MVTGGVRTWWLPTRVPAWTAVLVFVAVAVAASADPVPTGGSRLWAKAVLVAGAGLLVARVGVADLSLAATVGVGAVAGAVLPPLAGLPLIAGVPTAIVAGGLLGAVSGAVQGRAGRQLGALATLALGLAVVAMLRASRPTGGVVGFHAVPLPTGAGDRADALVVGLVAVVALVVVQLAVSAPRAAGAALAAADPALARSLGRRPVVDLAWVGAWAGAVVGLGGLLLAAVDGSVVPAAYGLELAAALLLAAAVGGIGPYGAVLGTLVVWGPSTMFPFVPVLGSAPVLAVAGPVGLAILAFRRGRPLTRHRILPPAVAEAPGRIRPGVEPVPVEPSAPAAPHLDTTDTTAETAGPVLRLRGTRTPGGPVDLDVAAGEIVAVRGPNGSGKSTLLARIGGQLPDDGSVEIGGSPAPPGPTRRARLGVRRTWQRPPSVDARDAARVVVASPGRRPALHDTKVTALLGPAATSLGGHDLRRLVAGAPMIALIDEPTDVPAEVVTVLLDTLAGAGTAVLVVDHRPEVVAAADRCLDLVRSDDLVRPDDSVRSDDPARLDDSARPDDSARLDDPDRPDYPARPDPGGGGAA